MTTQIPSHLLPRDGRFGSGPSKVRPAQLAHVANAGSLMGTSHRQRPVRQLVGKIRSQLAELFSAPDGYEVILGNGGASLLWDAIAFNVVQERAQAAVFGEFSSKPVKPLSNVPWVSGVDVRQVEPGGGDRAGDHVLGPSEVVLVVGVARRAVREHQGRLP